MPFDQVVPERREGLRIAVVGTGVSGLSAAWLLARSHDVVVYEAEARLGGHANTVDAQLKSGERVPVDAGFIVFNEAAYPNLTALFAHLGVRTEPSCMSFGASLRDGETEYSGQSLSSVFADRSKAMSPRFLSMLADIARFHRDARRSLVEGLSAAVSMAEFVGRRGYGRAFVGDFLKPMASAIWSTPASKILDYSALAFIRFYENHGLLRVLDLPAWRTVSGGARRYVEKISAGFARNVRLATPVTSIRRLGDGVEISDARGGLDRFDAAVIAVHADAALRLIEHPSTEERRLLGAFRYQKNKAVVHFDETAMPRRRLVWSSWNYVGGRDRAGVTYWMNRLQNLARPENVFVTLNPSGPALDDSVVAEFEYEHPIFDVAAAAAQRELWTLQGRSGVWYCGAHFGQGFHEDGMQAGLAVAEALGRLRRPWSVAHESGRIFLAPARASAP
jgi:hypothetical protein